MVRTASWTHRQGCFRYAIALTVSFFLSVNETSNVRGDGILPEQRVIGSAKSSSLSASTHPHRPTCLAQSCPSGMMPGWVGYRKHRAVTSRVEGSRERARRRSNRPDSQTTGRQALKRKKMRCVFSPSDSCARQRGEGQTSQERPVARVAGR